MGNAISVLFAVEPAPTGGLEQVTVNLAGGLAGKGHEVGASVVLTGDFVPERFLEQLRARGVEVFPIDIGNRRYLSQYRNTIEICRDRDPDVVHTHGYRADVVDGTAARRAGKPTVSTVHGFTGGGLKNRLLETVQRRALRRFDAVVAVSDDLVRRLRDAGVPPPKLEVVRNTSPGRDDFLPREAARRKLDLPTDAFVLGWVGRFSEEKGPDLFLRALEELSPPSALGCMVGPGTERVTERPALPADLPHRLVSAGFVPNASRLFKAFDVLVLSSRSEGTPMVMFEAMAARVPVAATRVGGVPEVLDGTTAYLVPPGEPGTLAGAVERIRARPEEADRRAERAEVRLREGRPFDAWIDQYVELYRRVTSR